MKANDKPEWMLDWETAPKGLQDLQLICVIAAMVECDKITRVRTSFITRENARNPDRRYMGDENSGQTANLNMTITKHATISPTDFILTLLTRFRECVNLGVANGAS